MENEITIRDADIPAIADDNLLAVAQQAERRIEAVIKIKQMALKVTNANDWVDQNGKPYLMASGSEKIANLFNISWRIEEPRFEEEPDGHYTYTYMGTFSIPGRSVQVDGSRSSKDPFFKKYDWIEVPGQREKKKIEKPISSIDRRDVKMAAMTNLLGNGITRLLGIRNLTYEDLAAFAGITREMVGGIDYKAKGQQKPPLKEPQPQQPAQSATEEPSSASDSTEAQQKAIHAMFAKMGIKDDYAKMEWISKRLGLPEVITSTKELSKTHASFIIKELSAELDSRLGNKSPNPSLADPSSELLTTTQNIVSVEAVPFTVKSGPRKGQQSMQYIIIDGAKTKYRAFSKTVADTAIKAMDAGIRTELGYTPGEYGNELKIITLVEMPGNPIPGALVCPQDNSLPVTIEGCAMCRDSNTCEVAKEIRGHKEKV